MEHPDASDGDEATNPFIDEGRSPSWNDRNGADDDDHTLLYRRAGRRAAA